jgi:hypothetical protein
MKENCLKVVDTFRKNDDYVHPPGWGPAEGWTENFVDIQPDRNQMGGANKRWGFLLP